MVNKAFFGGIPFGDKNMKMTKSIKCFQQFEKIHLKIDLRGKK